MSFPVFSFHKKTVYFIGCCNTLFLIFTFTLLRSLLQSGKVSRNIGSTVRSDSLDLSPSTYKSQCNIYSGVWAISWCSISEACNKNSPLFPICLAFIYFYRTKVVYSNSDGPEADLQDTQFWMIFLHSSLACWI